MTPRTEVRILRQKVAALEENEHTLMQNLQGMYAQNVLQDAYCARTRNQLFGREEEEKDKEEGNSRLPTSAAVLTSRKFRRRVKKMKAQKLAKESAKKNQEDAMKTYRDAKDQWERDERARVQRNKDGRAHHRLDLESWEAEKRAAKAEGRQTAWERPAPFVVEKTTNPKPACPGCKRKAAELTVSPTASGSLSSEASSESSSDGTSDSGSSTDDSDEASDGEED